MLLLVIKIKNMYRYYSSLAFGKQQRRYLVTARIATQQFINQLEFLLPCCLFSGNINLFISKCFLKRLLRQLVLYLCSIKMLSFLCFLWFYFSSCRPSDERHPAVTADGTADDVAQAVNLILSQRGH